MRSGCPLHLRGREIASIFELSGRSENDLTASLGWVLSRCERLRATLLNDLRPGAGQAAIVGIWLERLTETRGYTDIEIRGEAIHCIVEAKRGWHLPTDEQLDRYRKRSSDGPEEHVLLVLSECSPDYAAANLSHALGGTPILHRSWREVRSLAGRVADRAPVHERRLLAEFDVYLRRAMSMQDQESNIVYVVSLGAGRPEGASISWRDIVNAKRRYFHPYLGKFWPKEPPNYLGFRYGGKLQSIHHVDGYEVVDHLHARIPEISPAHAGQHIIYTLGDPIRPAHDVSNGRVHRASRVRAMIDLLLTCGTVSEARDLTEERRAALRKGRQETQDD